MRYCRDRCDRLGRGILWREVGVIWKAFWGERR